MSAISIPLADERSGRTKLRQAWAMTASAVVLAVSAGLSVTPAEAQEKRPNIVMLMTDDTGWNDFGTYSGGGAALGHPTPNIDQIAKEGPTFTN
jgi:Sulfatase